MTGLCRLKASTLRASVGAIFSCASCAPGYRLSTVPITGGTPEQEQALRSELVFFEDAVGDDVRLRSVEVVDHLADHGGAYAGEYAHHKRRVRVWGGAEDPTIQPIESILRHELCHATDRQRGDLSMELGLAALHTRYAAPPLTGGSKREEASELFAQWCDAGGLLSELWAHRGVLDAVEREGRLSVVDAVWGRSMNTEPMPQRVIFEVSTGLKDLYAVKIDEKGQLLLLIGEQLLEVRATATGALVEDGGTLSIVDYCSSEEPFAPELERWSSCGTERGAVAVDGGSETVIFAVSSFEGSREWVFAVPSPKYSGAQFIAGPDDRLFGVWVQAGILTFSEILP